MKNALLTEMRQEMRQEMPTFHLVNTENNCLFKLLKEISNQLLFPNVQVGSGICRPIFHDALPGRTLMVKTVLTVYMYCIVHSNKIVCKNVKNNFFL